MFFLHALIFATTDFVAINPAVWQSTARYKRRAALCLTPFASSAAQHFPRQSHLQLRYKFITQHVQRNNMTEPENVNKTLC